MSKDTFVPMYKYFNNCPPYEDPENEPLCGDEYDERWVDVNRRRSKDSYPYAYSDFFHFGTRKVVKELRGGAEYSDRIHDSDPLRVDELWRKHMRGVPHTGWNKATRKQLNAFMSDFYGRKVAVVALAEGCKPNGYAYFILWTKDIK